LLLEDIKDLVAASRGEPVALLPLLHEGKQRKRHVNTRNMAEHLLELDLLGVHEEGVRDIHGAELLALPAVDAGIGDVGVPDQVEHEVWRDLARCHEVRLLGAALDAVADRACFDAGVALDAP